MAKSTTPERLLRANVKSIQKTIKEFSGDKPTEFRIEGARGLVLMVMPTRTASWYFFYDVKTSRRKRRRKIKLGRFDDMEFAQARSRANQFRAMVEAGGDPADTQKELQNGITFAELAQERLSKGTPLRPATQSDYEALLRNDILPFIGEFPADEVSRSHIIEVLDRVSARGATRRTDTARAVISAIFSFGLDRGLVSANPASGLRNRHDNKLRITIATAADIRKLVQAIEDEKALMSKSTGRITLLALLTSQRRTEIAATRQQDVDLDGANPTLTVPRGLAKNRNAHRVPLSPQAARILREAIEDSEEDLFVFPGNKPGSPIGSRSVSKAMERTREALGLGGLSIHDLRRTAGTLMSQHGVPQHVRERILNHGGKLKGSLTEGVYNRYEYEAEKRAALELLADIIDSIMGRGPAAIDSYSVRLARLTGGDKIKVAV